MGRRKSKERMQFIDTGRDCNKSQTYHHCTHCLRAREADATVVIEDVIGSNASMAAHLYKCCYAPAEFREQPPRKYRKTNKTVVTNISPTTTSRTQHIATEQSSAGEPLSHDEEQLFLKRLVEFQADCALPDSFIERASVRRLFESLRPLCAPAIPSRRILGGTLLAKHAAEDEKEDIALLRDIQERSCGSVNFLSDVWMDPTRTHVLGCQLALHGVEIVIGLHATGMRHDGVAIAETMEDIMRRVVENGWRLGAVVTDDAAQCARARRILALRWPRIIFLKCFAHDLNNLVKGILKSPSFRDVTAEASAIVTCINASSSKWLKACRDTMDQTYGFNRALLPLCETRWNSMQCCFASLLRMQTALQVFVVKHREDSDFPTGIFSVLEKRSFWRRLRDAEEAVRPLCFASYKLQQNENTMADVVVCYRDLFDGFRASDFRDSMVPLLEKRWEACEQPLFMVALYLHPAYVEDARALPTTSISGIENVSRFALYYFDKMVGGDPKSLRGDLFDWIQGNFVTANMSDFVNVSLPPLPAFWRFAKEAKKTSVLPDLAIAIMSVVVNTATCERFFSQLSRIHTARRNRLASEKSMQISRVQNHVKRMDQADPRVNSTKPRTHHIVPPDEPPTLMAVATPIRRRQSSSRSSSPYVITSSVVYPTEDVGVMTRAGSVDEQEADPGDPDALKWWEEVFKEWVENPEDLDEDTEPCTEGDSQDGASQSARQEHLPFPDYNDRNFPQEAIPATSIRAQKATLAELFVFDDSTSRCLSF